MVIANTTSQVLLPKIGSLDWKLKLDAFARNVKGMNTLNPQIDRLLTEICGRQHLTRSQKKFLKEAIRINIEDNRPFDCYDFPLLSRGNFRQIIFRLKEVIKKGYKSNPCLYRVKGTPWKKRLPIVNNSTRASSMIELLKKLKDQPPKIHDIKLKIYSNLHRYLSQEKVNPKNHGIKKRIQLSQEVWANVLVYPDVVQVDLACTDNPLIYDIDGVIRLTFLLGQLYAIMQFWASFKASIAPFYEWIITHYHFGKDSTESYSGQTFHITYDDFSNGMVRFYSKKMKNGNTIARIEQIHTPRKPLEKEINKIIALQSVS